MLLLSPWPRFFLPSQEDKVSLYLPFTWLEFFMLITETIHIIEKSENSSSEVRKKTRICTLGRNSLIYGYIFFQRAFVLRTGKQIAHDKCLSCPLRKVPPAQCAPALCDCSPRGSPAHQAGPASGAPAALGGFSVPYCWTPRLFPIFLWLERSSKGASSKGFAHAGGSLCSVNEGCTPCPTEAGLR